MPDQPLNVHQVELFCAVVERGSFALAGAEMCMSPQALSIQVKRLERTVGIALLRRVPGGMAPTRAGQELYAMARAMLDLRQVAGRRMAELRQGTVGALSIGVIHDAPLYYLAEVLRDFSQVYPRVPVTVEMREREEILDAMGRGSVDLGLDWEPVVRAGVVAEPLLAEPWVIVAAPHHPLAALVEVSRAQFAAAPFLGLQFGVRSPGFGELALSEAGLRPHVVMRLPSTDAVKRLVEAGLGIGLMGRIAAERELTAGRLTALAVQGFEFQRTLLLFRPTGRLRSPAAATFRRFLRQHPRIYGGASQVPARPAARDSQV